MRSSQHSSAGRTRVSRLRRSLPNAGRAIPCRDLQARINAVDMEHPHKDAIPHCPSSQPVEGGVVFAIIQGTASEPRAGYLDRLIPLTPQIAATTASVSPTEVFRMSAPCAGDRCRHYSDGRCSLVKRLVHLVPRVVTTPPRCALRPDCMWWLQEGIRACLRCPQVVTHMYGASPRLVQAASPPE